MPLVNRTDITDPVTPSKLEVVLKPIRVLQWNGLIDEDNFKQEAGDTNGIPIHAGSVIRTVTDLVDSAKTFDGRSIFTDLDLHNDVIVAGSVYDHFSNNTFNNEKDFFEVHARIANALYKPEYTVRDIDFKMSYTRDDLKATFRTYADREKKVLDLINRIRHRQKTHFLMEGAALQAQEDRARYEKELTELRAANDKEAYEYVSVSQSIEVEIPTGYEFDRWEVFGDLDWGWINETDYMSVGVLYVEVDNTRDDFLCFKLSLLFDQDVALDEDEYVLAAGKLQYRLKRYA